jgi:hypothetical protein
MGTMQTIYRSGVWSGPIIRSSPSLSPKKAGALIMSINSLLYSLLAAYACGASGTYETPKHEV